MCVQAPMAAQGLSTRWCTGVVPEGVQGCHQVVYQGCLGRCPRTGGVHGVSAEGACRALRAHGQVRVCARVGPHVCARVRVDSRYGVLMTCPRRVHNGCPRRVHNGCLGGCVQGCVPGVYMTPGGCQEGSKYDPFLDPLLRPPRPDLLPKRQCFRGIWTLEMTPFWTPFWTPFGGWWVVTRGVPGGCLGGVYACTWVVHQGCICVPGGWCMSSHMRGAAGDICAC